jgi:hypothetical protein
MQDWQDASCGMDVCLFCVEDLRLPSSSQSGLLDAHVREIGGEIK